MLNLKRLEIEAEEEWREKWIGKIPALTFPEDWEVKIIPPFAGALIRFHVFKGEKWVSVYLDVFGRLAPINNPYWEIYPHGDDVYRTDIEDTEGLMNKIAEALEQQEGEA